MAVGDRQVGDCQERARIGSRVVARNVLVMNVMAAEECQGDEWTGCERSGSQGLAGYGT